MSTPSPSDINKVLNTLRKLPLWLFLAIAAGSALVLILDRLGFVSLTATDPAVTTWTWIALSLASCLAVARGIQAGIDLVRQRREARSELERLRFIPLHWPRFWSASQQKDGSYVTQISVETRVTNVSDTDVLIAKVRLISPKPKGELVHADLLLPAEGSPYFSPRHPVPARSTLQGRANVMVRGRLGKPGKSLVVTLGVTDHFNREYKVVGIDLRSMSPAGESVPIWKLILTAPQRIRSRRAKAAIQRAASVPPTIWAHGGRFANVDAVLNEELRHYAANGRQRGGLGSLGRLPTIGAPEGHAPRLLADPQAAHQIECANLDLLVRLNAGAGQAEAAEMNAYLLSHLNRISPFANVVYLVFMVLHRAGLTVDALRAARANFVGDQENNYSNLLATLALLVQNEYATIPEDVLTGIIATLEGDTEHDFALRQTINAVRVRRLGEAMQADQAPQLPAARTARAAGANPAESNYDPDQAQVLQALGFESMSLDHLVGRLGLPVEQISAVLLKLELDGQVAAGPGDTFTRLQRT